MRWNLRMVAAERGIWKSTELRRLLAAAGLDISAGKMSALWTGTPTTIRLDDLDVLCAVLDCEPSRLLMREPDAVAARGPQHAEAQAGTRHGSREHRPASGQSGGGVRPRLGRNRTTPPV